MRAYEFDPGCVADADGDAVAIYNVWVDPRGAASAISDCSYVNNPETTNCVTFTSVSTRRWSNFVGSRLRQHL